MFDKLFLKRSFDIVINISKQVDKIKNNRMENFKYGTKKFQVAKEQVEDLLKTVCISVLNKHGLVADDTDLLSLFSFVQLRTNFEFDLTNILLNLRMWEQMIKIATEEKDSFLFSSAISKRIVVAAFVNELSNYYNQYMIEADLKLSFT